MKTEGVSTAKATQVAAVRQGLSPHHRATKEYKRRIKKKTKGKKKFLGSGATLINGHSAHTANCNTAYKPERDPGLLHTLRFSSHAATSATYLN